MNPTNSKRILLVDDNPAIHADYKKVLCNNRPNVTLQADDELIFGKPDTAKPVRESFATDSAFQGAEALKLVTDSVANESPFSVALIDIRMPPGWDGVETARRIWEVDPRILIVFCTAYSDYSWTEMTTSLQRSDQFVILKKPFDNLELMQLVIALSKKWELEQNANVGIESLNQTIRRQKKSVGQARSSIRQYVERLKLACIDMVYRQCRSELHECENETYRPPKAFGSEFLEQVNQQIQLAADTAHQKLSDNETSAELAGGQVSNDNCQILQIVDNLLVLSELDDNRFQAVDESFSTVNLIDEIQHRYSAVAGQVSGLQFSIHADAQIPQWLCGDEKRTRLLLANIIDNAFEHTESGAIELQITLLKKDTEPKWVEFTVSDTGRGLHEGVCQTLSNFFANGEWPGENCVQLGLLVCKRLVDLLQGEISFESTPGTGTSFKFVLPFLEGQSTSSNQSNQQTNRLDQAQA